MLPLEKFVFWWKGCWDKLKELIFRKETCGLETTQNAHIPPYAQIKSYRYFCDWQEPGYFQFQTISSTISSQFMHF